MIELHPRSLKAAFFQDLATRWQKSSLFRRAQRSTLARFLTVFLFVWRWWQRVRQARQKVQRWQQRLPSWLLDFGLQIGLGFIATSVFFHTGFPYTHDGENHLTRFVNYAAAFKEFGWPPRWAPFLFNHYGFPVFLYNYPLANILALPGVLLGVDPRHVFALIVWGSVSLGAWATATLVRQAGQSRQAAAWASIAFVTLAPITSLWLIRGNIGELLAISLFLACGCAVRAWEQALEQRQNVARSWGVLALLLGLLVIAHNIFALLFLPLLVLRSLPLLSEPKSRGAWLILWSVVLFSGLWFWVPALGSLSWVVLQSDSLAQSAVSHLFTIEQLLWDPLRFGFSLAGSVDSLGMGLGLLGTVSLVGTLATLWSPQKERRFSASALMSWWLLLITTLAGIFFATTWSYFIWSLFPQLSLVQFPWRFLVLAATLLPTVVASRWDHYPQWWRFLLIVLLVPQVLNVLSFSVADRVRGQADQYLTSPHTSLTRNENRPRTLTPDPLPSWQPGPQFLGETAPSHTVRRWRGLTHEYELTTLQPIVVVEPTVSFPGWHTTVDGKTIEVYPSEQGLISYEVPASSAVQTVRTRFTQLWWWRLSDVLSLVGIGFGGLYVWYLARH